MPKCCALNNIFQAGEEIKTKFFYGALGVVFVFSFFINAATVYDGHNWGGDFSQYIIHAKNMVEGNAYDEGIMLDTPVVYPPGYPLMLAGLLKIFGMDFKAFKFFNLFLWYAALVPIFIMITRRLGKEVAAFFLLFLATSSNFFVFKQNILSDILFFFLVNLTLCFFTERCAHQAPSCAQRNFFHFGIFILLMMGAFLVRSAGAILFLAAFFYFAVIRKDFKRALIIAAGFMAVFALQTFVLGFHKGFFSEILYDPQAFLGRSLVNSALVFKAIFWFFNPGQTILTEGIFYAVAPVITFVSPVLYAVGFSVFMYQLIKRKLSYSAVFFSFYLMVLFVWSGFESDIRGFVRFVLPITVCCFIFLFESLERVMKKFLKERYKKRYLAMGAKAILGFFIIINLFNIYGIYDFNDDVLGKAENQQLITWVKENIAPDEHYMIWRPRPMALLTERIGTVFWREDLKEGTSFFERVRRLNISYLIFSKYVDQAFILNSKRNPLFSQPVWENDAYIVFKVAQRF